jgi:hypothetical protein
LSHIEIDEVLSFMSHIGSEVSSDDAVPGGIVLLVELLLDVGGDVLFNIEFLEGNIGAINCVLLHLLVHVGVLDDGLSFCC